MATAAKKKPSTRPPPAATKEKFKQTAIVKRKAAAQEKNFAKLRAKAAVITDPLSVSTKPIALRKDDRFLTEMQMMFVRHWAAGESVLSASARAGYRDGGTYGYRLAKDPAVIKIYEREKKLYEESCQMTRKRVMDGFIEAAEMARVQADPTSMTGAWREIGKMCGYYEPVRTKIDITVNGQITQKIERLSDEDLLKIIKGEGDPNIIDADFREVEE